MRSKSKGNIFWIILLAAVVLFCGYKIILNIKEKNEYKAQLAVASENSVRYIRNKYGFEAEFIKERENEFDRKNIGVMYLDFRYNSKEFMVIADCLNDSGVCVDTYQHKEVEQAVIDKVLSEYPNGKTVSVSIGEKTPFFSDYMYFLGFQTYYDGSNLDEVLTDSSSGKVEMIFVNTDFSDTGIADWLAERNIDVEFTSFDTEEHLAEFEALPTWWSMSDYSRYAKLAPYITDHVISNVTDDNISYETRELENFKYCCFEKDDFDNYLTEMDQNTFINQCDYYGNLECLKQPLTKAYKIYGDTGEVYIYYPLDKLNGIDIKHIGAVWYIKDRFETSKNIEKAEIYGDYAVFILPGYAEGFMLTDLREQTE